MSAETRTEVAVIGGGIVGCATALALARAGRPVVLLEKGMVGAQASGVNFGGVRQLGRAAAELPLARRSRRLWDRIESLIGEDGGFRVNGHLRLATNEAEMADYAAHREVARDHGLAVELLDRAALHARHPWLGESVIGGMFLAEDGHANPRRVSPAFGRAARAAGAEVLERTEVTECRRSERGFRIETRDGRTVEARVLVNAAGAWAGRIAAGFGDPDPITPNAPQVAVSEPVAPFMGPVLGIGATHAYMRQDPRGNVIFGADHGRVDAETGRAHPLPATTLAQVAGAMDTVPRLAGLTLIRVWSGVEGYTPDDLPVLGPSLATPGLFHAFGFSGHGFQLGPAVGEVVAELIAGGRTETPIEAFAIQRFRPPSPERPGE